MTVASLHGSYAAVICSLRKDDDRHSTCPTLALQVLNASLFVRRHGRCRCSSSLCNLAGVDGYLSNAIQPATHDTS
jgi:hypothetical protein